MGRSRASAKAAGSTFERQVADCLALYIDDRIDRRVKTGAKDKGDIAGMRHQGQRVVLECKNVAALNLAGWMREAEDERGNDDALFGAVVHKRHGKGNPLDQWVTMTMREFIALLSGARLPED